MIYVLAYVEEIERVKFYLRFTDIKVTFITTNITVFCFLKLKRQVVYYIRPKHIDRKLELNEKTINNISNTIEVKLNNMKHSMAIDTYKLIYQKLEEIFEYIKFNYIFLWNGCKVGDLACTDFARFYDIQLYYFEVANIPGKLFVDQQGTNKKSSIFTNPEQLDFFDKKNMHKYFQWKKEYLKTKFGNYVLPQSKYANKLKRLISPILNIIVIRLGIGIPNNVYYRNFKRIFSSNIKVKFSSNIDYKCENYVFVPLQVSDNKQIIINSDIGLKELIDYSFDYAQKHHLKLVIKPHPAEKNNGILNYIKSINSEDIIVSNDNTMKLIENSEIVITINSTVGLEALIVDKPVKFLGDSFYSKFNKNRLINYVMSYLKKVDYFSNEKINVSEIFNLENF